MWGDRVPVNSSSRALRPSKTEKTATTRAVDIKVVLTSPLQTSLCLLQVVFSTAMGNKATRTVSRESTVEKACLHTTMES